MLLILRFVSSAYAGMDYAVPHCLNAFTTLPPLRHGWTLFSLRRVYRWEQRLYVGLFLQFFFCFRPADFLILWFHYIR